jgi:tetratricopeptide (TPR) repeat protein
MNKLSPHIFLAILLAFFISAEAQTAEKIKSCGNQADSDPFSQYAGRFGTSGGSVLFVEEQAGELTLRPVFWRAAQPLRRISGDDFEVEDRTDRKVSFVRNAESCVVSVKIIGFGDDGTFPRLGDEKVPLELLFAGKARDAAEQMLKANPNAVEDYVKIAQMLLQRFPSKSSEAAEFLTVLAAHSPRAVSVHAVLGDAFIAAGKRKSALKNYLKAYKLDAANKTALRGLRRLRALPTALADSNGWTLPFSLDKVFAKPTRAEIKAVEADWSKRDLSPQNVVKAASGKINLGYTEASVRIISHTVHGQKHYGAIIVPDGIGAKAPVILDLKGVSWNYFPLDLNQLISPKFLGKEQNKFIYVVPSFRGEVLKFDGREYVSEGDRTDSWDGATDDALALLNTALSITPQTDASRICAFGKSRGGSVALLAGIREPKIKMVLDWAGPADWFALMATEGWTQKEIAADALLNKAAPKDDGGQFIERFLAKAIEGKRSLEQVRFKMLASSPLYFAEGLAPRVQIHYGIEDEMVPIVNGSALERIMRKSMRNSSTFESFFHANAGHDLNSGIASKNSKRFVLSLLASEK